MVVLDLPYSGIETAELIRVGKEEGLKIMGGRIVVHCQIVDEAVMRLERVMEIVLAKKAVIVVQEEQSDYR
jgi:threonine aldolase